MHHKSNPPRTVGFAIKAASNQIKRLLDGMLENSDTTPNLTGMQFGMINYIGNHSEDGEVFQRDIEAEFHIRRSTATGILQLLEKNGYIIREAVPYDQRLKKLMLTPMAEAARVDIRKNIKRSEEIITRGITPEEIETFHRIMGKIIENTK